MKNDIYIVRQHASVFVGFVLGGFVFCVFPWTFANSGSVLMRTGMTLLGVIAICVGVLGWKNARIGLVADRHGLWCGGFHFSKKQLIPWADITQLSKVTWGSPEGEHEGLLIDIGEKTIYPGGVKHLSIVKSELKRLFGEVDYMHPLLIGHDEWDWDIDKFVALASRCVNDSKVREELGEYNTTIS